MPTCLTVDKDEVELWVMTTLGPEEEEEEVQGVGMEGHIEGTNCMGENVGRKGREKNMRE